MQEGREEEVDDDRGGTGMNFNSPLWVDKWRSALYPRAFTGTVKSNCGSDEEPLSSLWCACLAESFGHRWRDGVKVLDYGCGYGRFCNFMTGWLRGFVYYGLEVPHSTVGHGQACLEFARRELGAWGRFGFLGSELEAEALAAADVVLLGSILPHMTIEQAEETLKKFLPVVERGGSIVFSVILWHQYELVGPGAMGMPDHYGYTAFTRRQIEECFNRLGLRVVEAETFECAYCFPSTGDRMCHTIFRAEGLKRP